MSNAALLPPNARLEEVALSSATARLANTPPHCREMWNPATCPAQHLPWLAWAFSVDEWNASWAEPQKRAAIEASYTIHRHKGTVGAVKTALSTLDWEAHIVEWYHAVPHGPAYTFRVEITLDRRGIQPSIYDDVTRLVLASKNTRSHLTGIALVHAQHAQLRIASACIATETVTVLPLQITDLQSAARVNCGLAVITHDITHIYPQVH